MANNLSSIYILTGLRGFRVKIVNFVNFFYLSIPKIDFPKSTKKTIPNTETCLASLVTILEYWYNERSLFPWDGPAGNQGSCIMSQNKYLIQSQMIVQQEINAMSHYLNYLFQGVACLFV